MQLLVKRGNNPSFLKGENMTYQEYKDKRQSEFNALPIFWAFSMKQFEEEMNKRGLTKDDQDKLFKFGNGGFYLKSDADKIREFINKPDEFPELAKDKDFLLSAFNYEMDNHEYAINYYQGDWDVCSVFFNCEYEDSKDYKDYLKEGGHEDWIPVYEQARKEHFERAKEWF